MLVERFKWNRDYAVKHMPHGIEMIFFPQVGGDRNVVTSGHMG